MESEIKMFCYQCEQTAGGTGCRGMTGVCGKTARVSDLQDRLTGALVGLARSPAVGDLGPDGDMTMAPDGSYHSGSSTQMYPDGSYGPSGDYHMHPDGSYGPGHNSYIRPDGSYGSTPDYEMTPNGGYVDRPSTDPWGNRNGMSSWP